MKLSIILGIVAIVLGVGAICALCRAFYRVADIDKALVITGGKEPKIVVSGGAFVIPIFRKASYFDLCLLTVQAAKDEIKTITATPIVVDWTAQIRPNTNDIKALEKAIISFKERGQKGIIDDVRLTLTGAVRDIVASMTPEEVLRDKEKFAQKVKDVVRDEMDAMGMDLVSLNIQDITDNNGYYDNLAALDMEDKRREAEKKRATVEQEIRQQKADSEQAAAQKELASQLVIAEKERDNSLKKAGYKAETDKAMADANIAGRLQSTIREREVAEQEGHVAVVRQEQANLAAMKEKEVIATRAEAEKKRQEIAAEATANIRKIEADAEVQVAEKKAAAVKIEADASADRIRKEGNAEADVIQQKGIAEAEAEKARYIAQAEGERALAEARASNDKVNFEIEKIKIENEAKITIATKTAEIMANIGQNAEFINFGGQGTIGGTGNVLMDTLAAVPMLMKKLDIENNALNGQNFNSQINEIVSSVAEAIKGKSNETSIIKDTMIVEDSAKVEESAKTEDMAMIEESPVEIDDIPKS